MSSLSGRRHERGRRSLSSSGTAGQGGAEPPIDRLTADRLAGVLSLLHSATPGAPTMRLPEGASQGAAEDVYYADSGEQERAHDLSMPTDLKPLTLVPDVWEPVGVDRDALDRDALDRDALDRDALNRDALNRDALDRDAWAPDVPEPEVSSPEVSSPDVSSPEVSSPEVLEREIVTEPASAESEALAPKTPSAGRHRRPAQRKRGVRKVLAALGMAAVTVAMVAAAVGLGLGALKALG